MTTTVNATPLYKFLRYCELSSLEKTVLDCGAGGDLPPLSLFYRHGYRTNGIELSKWSLDQANRYCCEQGLLLNILHGDMRHIPFPAESYNFVYSWNAIFFMTKPDIEIALFEMARVLRNGGLCFVKLLLRLCQCSSGSGFLLL